MLFTVLFFLDDCFTVWSLNFDLNGYIIELKLNPKKYLVEYFHKLNPISATGHQNKLNPPF